MKHEGFFIKDAWLINIQGVESPGVTSCLSIGKYVLNLIKS